jgi:pimeloyl-ACP methyl ester carboxylesterase
VQKPRTTLVGRTEELHTLQTLVTRAPGNWVWAYGLIANFKRGHQETWVDYTADRAPLLFIGGQKDHIMPPSVNKSNAKHYDKSPAVTEYYEFAGRDHWTCAAPGWEAVADYALDWALAYADTKPRGRHTA